MSDNNFKDYDLDNFDDTKPYGRHFKEDSTQQEISYNLEDFTAKPTKQEQPQAEPKTPDYGDDFYAEGNSFEPDIDDDEEFQPVITRKSYSRTAKIPDKNKKKNVTVIVLSITFALIIFLFSLLFFIGSKLDSKEMPTTSSTTAMSETVVETEQTQPATEAPTEELTQAPTEAPTEAETEPETEPPTEPETEEETAEDMEFSEETVAEEFI